jgi:hypothetical protein
MGGGMKLTGKYRIVIEGDASNVGTASHDAIGYLFQRLLTGLEADMTNLSNLGITVRYPGEDDEFVRIERME